jgi:DNA-binding transcriptional ArsR family regulator
VEAYQVGDVVLDALGDGTRRRVVELLRHGPMPVGELAEHLPVSRPAVSQHLKVLKGAGLVVERREGTRRLYSVDPRGATALQAYVERVWGETLDRFKEAADRRGDIRAQPSQRRSSGT